MSEKPFSDFGFTTTLTKKNANALKNEFHKAVSRRRKTGTFIGTNQLRIMLNALEAGGFDGLQVCYGLQKTGTLPGEPTAIKGSYELILTEIKIEGPENNPTITERGTIYTSVPDIATEPPGLSCPPLKCREENS